MQSEHDRKKYQTGEPRRPSEIDESIIVSPDTGRDNRIPPGQSRTLKWPVLHYGYVPTIDMAAWSLEVIGLVERPLRFNWEEFQALPRVRVYSDFHCVTQWSRLDNVWEGVSTREILGRAGVRDEAKYVILHGYDDGFTTNLPLADFMSQDALLADTHDNLPLNADHGGPLRAIVPRLYAWKSAKWLKAIELSAEDRPGLWERGGYHNHGDPWREERFGNQE
jgi:DMSO/TMAO reductase YedYZ molybdopterin-dependent catalytic subunit